MESTRGWRPSLLFSLVDHWILNSAGPRSGDSYCTAFTRRSWKRAALFCVPMPMWRLRLLVEVKLPLETPRNDTSSPYSLNGVSKRPSFTVPQPLCARPTNESRCAKPVLLLSRRNCVSSWKIAFRFGPSFSWPRTPKRELEDSISVRSMIRFSPSAGRQIVQVAVPVDVAPFDDGNTSSG